MSMSPELQQDIADVEAGTKRVTRPGKWRVERKNGKVGVEMLNTGREPQRHDQMIPEEREDRERQMKQAPTPGPLSGDDWLTIDTAPKDGSRFESQDRTNYKRRVFTNTYWYVHPAVKGFVTEEIDCTDYEFEPTHWRPSRLAPTAPVEASGSEREHGPKCWGGTSFSDEMAHCYCGSTDLRPQPSGETR